MNILVTGANGQLGSEIRKKINQYPSWSFIFSDVEDVDITNLANLENFVLEHSINTIVNCAAYTAVDLAETQVKKAHLVNVVGPENLAKVSKEHHIKLIHISTDFIFDGEKSIPYTEIDEPNPISVYGKTKLEGEQKILDYLPSALIIRTSWLYSAYGNNFVKTMLRLGSERKELKVVFDQVGTPTWGADLTDTILILLSKMDKGEEFKGIYHYSNEGVASWYDFAIEIMNVSRNKCQVLPIESKEYPTAAQRPAFCVLNKQKIKEELGIQIPHWKISLEKCIAELN